MRRQALGLSQKELAKRLEVDQSSIRNWESGRRRPTGRYRHILDSFITSATT